MTTTNERCLRIALLRAESTAATRALPIDPSRAIVRRLAEEAGLRDTDSFARSWHILMEGSIVVAAEGDAQAARRGKSMARQLIDQYR